MGDVFVGEVSMVAGRSFNAKEPRRQEARLNPSGSAASAVLGRRVSRGRRPTFKPRLTSPSNQSRLGVLAACPFKTAINTSAEPQVIP